MTVINNLEAGLLRSMGIPEPDVDAPGVSVKAVAHELKHRNDFAGDQLRSDRADEACPWPDLPGP